MMCTLYSEGVCFNYRHPGPRRVWKGGSDLQLMTAFPGDPLDPLDPLDPVDPVENSRTHDFADMYNDFGTFARKVMSKGRFFVKNCRRRQPSTAAPYF